MSTDRSDFQQTDFDFRQPTHPPEQPPQRDVGAFVRDSDSVDFVKIDKHNLLFLGPTGSGKTYLLE